MKKVSKKLACELAKQYIGTNKIKKIESGCYFFENGKILLAVNSVFRIEKEQGSEFRYFRIGKEPYWDKEVISCRIWVGTEIKEMVFFTPDLKEIWREWHE